MARSRPSSTAGFGWLERVVRLPRLARMGLAIGFALCLTLLLTPLIDGVYMSNFDVREAPMLPALLSASAGVIAYLIGWRLLVGFADEAPQANGALAVYLVAGCAALLLTIVLVLLGAASGVSAV
jgi:hypothetical protein